jgi:TonB family protein
MNKIIIMLSGTAFICLSILHQANAQTTPKASSRTAEAIAKQTYHPGVGGVSYPSCAYCPNPAYPENALKAKYEGKVSLEAVITPNGHASNIHVLNGPDQGLGVEEKAVEILKRWRFKPAVAPTGKAVAVQIPIQVAFHLPASK